MTPTPAPRAVSNRMTERGSGKTAWHCGLCGAHRPVPSLAYLCELKHLEGDTASAVAA